jgi:ribosomal protein L3 glutamine methyltransferase
LRPERSVGAGRSRDSAPRRPTVADWLHRAERLFRQAGLSFGHGTANARDEAAWLVLHVAHRSYDDLEGALPVVLTTAQQRRAQTLIDQRIATRRPLAYLLREAWLGPHRFYVDERVIVPRSHIAALLARSLEPWITAPGAVVSALDLCTGSGCLAILTALAFPVARVDAVDVSPGALAVARRNVADYRLQTRVRLVTSDLFAALGAKRYDLIISNPPYVDARAMARLPAEYLREPRMALAGGRDGLAVVRKILVRSAMHLSAHGVLVMEIGNNRRALERAFPALPFTWLETPAGSSYVFTLTRQQIVGAVPQ